MHITLRKNAKYVITVLLVYRLFLPSVQSQIGSNSVVPNAKAPD